MNKIIITISALLCFLGCYAQPCQRVVVHADACSKLSRASRPFMLILRKGEDVHQAIRQCADAAHLKAAIVSGVGQLNHVKLGFFDKQQQQYRSQTFEGDFEMLALNGNITLYQGKHAVNLQCMLGDSDYHTRGGHLLKAEVAITGELLIRPLATTASRQVDEHLKVSLIEALSASEEKSNQTSP